MGPVEALKLALSKELEAIKLYNNLNLEHPTLRETFLFLVNEEEKHKHLIEKKIQEITKY
ncbi:MAG: ferritin family protein [Candidatus Omnitrophota bacterium]|nr:ferritin family protein [Candidatus Omnitrophota bacterium]